jgi:hypothetical protein
MQTPALRAALARPEQCAEESDCTGMPWCRIRKHCQRAALEQEGQEPPREPSVDQLDQIIDGLARCHVRQSSREFLRTWFRDWTAHKLTQSMREREPRPRHTPGPWQYLFEGGAVAFIVEADSTTVAKLSTTENTTAHSALPANVQLMAAAPDLLQALIGIVGLWDHHASAHGDGVISPLHRAARAAIDKAEGRP